MTNLIEDLSKDYNNEDDAVLNCVINNYTNANIHEQHNNLTCWLLDAGALPFPFPNLQSI